MRKYGFYWRYDTEEERAVLNRLWPLVNDRLNYLTPTIKPIGYATTRDGRRRRTYDQSGHAVRRGCARRGTYLARRIGDLQTRLLVLAKDKTEQLYLASFPSARPTSARASASRPADPWGSP